MRMQHLANLEYHKYMTYPRALSLRNLSMVQTRKATMKGWCLEELVKLLQEKGTIAKGKATEIKRMVDNNGILTEAKEH